MKTNLIMMATFMSVVIKEACMILRIATKLAKKVSVVGVVEGVSEDGDKHVGR